MASGKNASIAKVALIRPIAKSAPSSISGSMSKDDKTNKPSGGRDTHYATLRRQHRDRKRAEQGLAPVTRERTKGPKTGSLYQSSPSENVHLYGLHTVRAALANPRRTIVAMTVTQNALARLEIDDPAALPFSVTLASPQEIDGLLGSDAVHQGVLVEAAPLQPRALSALGKADLVIVLDQVTDPHNVGAIMRSAVAFAAGALITTARHSPAESGVLAKSASGALELIDHLTVRNLADAIITLKAQGFTCVGLDSEGPLTLEETLPAGPVALVLGAEGKGLRQKTRETVDALARLDMPGEIRSLNVSNAAAIALYAANRRKT